MTVKIITDSTADLPKEILEENNISFLPLHIHLGDEEYQDCVNIWPKQIFAWSDEHKATPKTSACSLPEAMGMLEAGLKDHDEVVFISISQHISSMYSVVNMAARELEVEDRVQIIDSRNLCNGIGLLVLKACELAKESKDALTIKKTVEALVSKVNTTFVVDTLEYLYRGGRCSGMASVIGSKLHIHPRIAVTQGTLHVTKKYLGSMEKALMSYVKDLGPALKNADDSMIFIANSGICAEQMEAVRAKVVEIMPFRKVYMTKAQGCISSHCGPGCIGIFFIEK